jgi:hypothetical protein
MLVIDLLQAEVYGDIDVSYIDKARFAVNLTGAYSRWDLRSLNVQQKTYESPVPMKNIEGESTSRATDQIRELESRIAHLEQFIPSFLPENNKDVDQKR